MEYSVELRKAVRKYNDYSKKYERYKTIFFRLKMEKWRDRAFQLYRIEWTAFCKANLDKQREEQNLSAVY